MTEMKDKVVTLELMKFYHDYNEDTYSKFVHLTSDGASLMGAAGTALTFAQVSEIATAVSNHVDVVYASRVMGCVKRSSALIEFMDVHTASNKYYIGWLTIGSDNRVAYKEIGVALSGDIIKNLSEMTADATHRVVTDIQINTWNNKSDFSGNWEDLNGKPIASVAETKTYLGISD